MDRLLDYSINHPLLAGGLLLMTIIVIGYELRQRGAMSSAVGPGEAVRLVNSGAVFVDLRSANLFKDGHITGAKNVPGDREARRQDGRALLRRRRDDRRGPADARARRCEGRLQPARRARGLEAGEPAGRQGLSVPCPTSRSIRAAFAVPACR